MCEATSRSLGRGVRKGSGRKLLLSKGYHSLISRVPAGGNRQESVSFWDHWKQYNVLTPYPALGRGKDAAVLIFQVLFVID